MTAESMPFATAIQAHRSDNRTLYSWSTEDPPLHARYRLEWHFRDGEGAGLKAPPKPSKTMSVLGIAIPRERGTIY